MDWNSTRAVDLLAIASSFAPPGSVKVVKVYPSDFGIKRMANDLTLGPRDIWKRQKEIEMDGDEDHKENDSVDIDEDDGGPDNDFEVENPDYGSDESVDDEVINDDDILQETYKNFGSANPNEDENEKDIIKRTTFGDKINKLRNSLN